MPFAEANIFERAKLPERESFRIRLDSVLDTLSYWETTLTNRTAIFEDQRDDGYFSIKRVMEGWIYDLPLPEKSLFRSFFNLFELKHAIGEQNKTLLDNLNKPHEGKFIGAAGPIGSCKTTVMAALISDLNADLVTKEPMDKNPFYQQSQEHPEYMLRSQMYYLLSNIFSDIKARLHPGVSVSDTSNLNDILVFAHWYHQIGLLNDEEYKTYTKIVEMLKPIIPKPDLLVTLIPDSIKDLKEGIRRRAEKEPMRAGELVFTTPESQDLAIQTQEVRQLVEEIPHLWNVPVLAITVPPIRTFEDPSLPYDYIYQIRDRLGLLGGLLNPQPEEVADEVVRKLAGSDQRKVVVIHAESMFTGKTTALWMLANKLGTDKVLAFQPRAAVHSAKKDNAVVTRDRYEIEGTTVEDNNLQTIVNKIKQKNISPKDKPYVLIDEIQLFTAHKDVHQQAIDALEELRKMGFHVIVNGIDYTFQQEPFTFMHSFLEMAKQQDSNWQQFQMSTRCRYCNEIARGTRRWKIAADGTRTIVDYSDTVFKAGDSEYEPVCCQEHKSCDNQPEGFQRKELPTTV